MPEAMKFGARLIVDNSQGQHFVWSVELAKGGSATDVINMQLIQTAVGSFAVYIRIGSRTSAYFLTAGLFVLTSHMQKLRKARLFLPFKRPRMNFVAFSEQRQETNGVTRLHSMDFHPFPACIRCLSRQSQTPCRMTLLVPKHLLHPRCQSV
jgi:hypothetical protein